MSTFVHTLDPQKQLFLKFSSPPLSPTQTPPRVGFLSRPLQQDSLALTPSHLTHLHVSFPAHTAVLALARGCRNPGVPQGSSTRESWRGMSESLAQERVSFQQDRLPGVARCRAGQMGLVLGE